MDGWHRVTKFINGKPHNYWERTTRVGKSVTFETRYIGPSIVDAEKRFCERPPGIIDQAAPPNVTSIPPTNLLFLDKARRQHIDQTVLHGIGDLGTSEASGYAGALNRQKADRDRATVRAKWVKPVDDPQE